MKTISNSNLGELRFFIGKLSPTERKILDFAKANPPFVATRVRFENLRRIFATGGVLSAREALQRGLIRADQITTPAIEDNLYGAHDCVFATVGPPNGRSRYGDVTLKLDPKVFEHAWATPQSGYRFLNEIRASDMKDIRETKFDDRVHLSHLISVAENWAEYLGLLFVKQLRKHSQEQRLALEKMLLDASDAKEFWNHSFDDGLANLEAKFEWVLELDWIQSIELPPNKYEEVIQWPESKPWINRIKH